MHRDRKPVGFYHLVHATVDSKNNILLSAHVTPGNFHDSKVYIDNLEDMFQKLDLAPKYVGADAGYFNIDIFEELAGKGITPVIGPRKYAGKKGKKSKYWFEYYPEEDIYRCFKGKDLDHRTNGYKNRTESMMKKTNAAILLIQRALDCEIKADYVLMDTWFTTEPMLKEILKTGLDAIGMVKQLKQRYFFRGKAYTLPQLRKFMQHENAINIFGSLMVTTKEGIPVKIVFIRNRNKKSECLYLLSTDCSLSDTEIVRTYGNRWSIEVFFKASKSFM